MEMVIFTDVGVSQEYGKGTLIALHDVCDAVGVTHWAPCHL